ncbi:MAG: GUN4 domain-containing protein [Microcystaceae cyanobacterium]
MTSDNQTFKPDKESSNSSLETQQKDAKKWIQKTAQTLIQWTPLGGSGGITISFLLQHEWFLSLLMFPVMIVTIIWARYTESFLTRLGEVYAERGRKDVDNLMSWQQKVSESLTETIKWQLARTDDNYLKCQASDCQQYKTEGFNTFKPNLRDVFVPLELSGGFFRRIENQMIPPQLTGFSWQKKLAQQAFSKEGLSIWYILRTIQKESINRSFIIQAWGGYGKTTLLRHITYIYSHNLDQKKPYKAPKLLPVLLYLRKWQEVMAQENAPDLPTLIEKHHIPSLAKGKQLKLPPNWAENHLHQGKFLILLDGFDEVKEALRKQVSDWISQQLKNYPYAYFILTSRPAGYKQYQGENRPNKDLWVKPLNIDQQSRFIEKWYWSWEKHISAEPDQNEAQRQAYQLIEQVKPKENEHNSLSDFAKVPLLLHMIVNLDANCVDEKLPQRRTDLFRDIIRLQLGDRPLARQIDMPLEFKESQQVLQQLALFMMQNNLTKIEPASLLNKLEEYLYPIDSSVAAKLFLEKMEQVSELLVKVDDHYEFAHKNFQEYLAALEIKDTQQEALLFDNHTEDWWKDIIVLYGIQLKNPSKFIRFLLALNTEKSIQLADKCFRQNPRSNDASIAEEIERQNLAATVQNARYQRLAELLRNRDFKAADEETYKVMIEVVEREEGQWFDVEDFDTFPCEDLRIINQLWLDNSEGKFGFSVQADIYRSLGGTRAYNSEVWEKFCDQVGWQVGRKWLRSKELIYELHRETPMGHLPSLTRFSLLSRKDLQTVR